MHFVHPYLLLLELLVPALAGLYYLAFRARKRALESFGESPLVAHLSSAHDGWRTARAALRVAAVCCIVLALARPQFGTKLVSVQQRAADIVIAVDVSASMTAEDIKPNRMARAKELLADLIRQLGGNRVGIIAFSGTAFWQCPLTLDTAGANLFLDIMDANLIPMGGTVIGDAIRLGVRGLEKTSPKTKALILLTDGEDHKSDPEGAAALAAKNGVKIFAVGFGSTAGEPIPLKDAQGNFTGYKKNAQGVVVMSKMDEGLLAKIAADTGGIYLRAQNGIVDTARLADAVRGLDKATASARLNRTYEDRFQYPLALGVLLLLASMLVPERKRGT